jgi:SH3-like domain-containing protein
VSRSGAHYRVAAAGAMRHGAVMASAADGKATRLAGAAPRQKTVRVALTRCSDRTGKVVATMRLKANGSGKIGATRGQSGLCVLSLRPA